MVLANAADGDAIVPGGECFEYPVKALYGDTNIEGNAYWLTFFRWFAQARELFFLHLMPIDPKEFLSRVNIATVETSIKHQNPLPFLGDAVVRVAITEVRECSVRLSANCESPDGAVSYAQGWQRVAFVSMDGKLVPIPSEFVERGVRYLAQDPGADRRRR